MESNGERQPATYREAGVDIDAGNRAVELMREHVRSTIRPGVTGDIGGFGGVFRLGEAVAKPGLGSTLLVAGADGVGTKLKVAFLTGVHDTVGIDCVAMNVNDIITTGAEPLFFLDYLAVGRLNPTLVAEIVKGVATGCRDAGCALLGGETAEMPDLYAEGEYDLAGFAVGLVDEGCQLDGSGVQPGTVLLGLRSSGLHSNGYSLVRHVLFERAGLDVEADLPELGCTLGDELLRPTRIYVRAMRAIMEETQVFGAAHITGGGLLENVPRALPAGLAARIDTSRWTPQPVFKLVQRYGDVPDRELWRTFNMGIGMVVLVDGAAVDGIQRRLDSLRMDSVVIGEVVKSEGPERVLLA